MSPTWAHFSCALIQAARLSSLSPARYAADASRSRSSTSSGSTTAAADNSSYARRQACLLNASRALPMPVPPTSSLSRDYGAYAQNDAASAGAAAMNHISRIRPSSNR